MATALYRLGRAAFRRRRLVLAIWLVLFAGMGVAAGTLSGPTNDRFSIPGTEAQQAIDLLSERLPQANGASGRIVFAAPEGEQLTGQQRTAVQESLARVGRSGGVLAASDPFATGAVSEDGRIALSSVTFRDTAQDLDNDTRAAVEQAADGAKAEGVQVEFGGDAVQQEAGAGGIGEVIGFAVAALVLAITFGSLVAAGLPLLTALVGVGIGLLGITTMTGFVDLSSTTPTLALMLGLAVGIDYALFIISRHRTQLYEGLDPEESAGRAVGTAGSAVVFAGATVVIALAALTVVGIPFLTAMGLAAAATVAVAVLVAITLVPALLGFAGTKLMKGKNFETGPRAAKPTMGARWVGFVTRHRVPAVLLTVIALGAAAIPVLSMRLGLPDDSTAAPSQTNRQAYDLLTEGFGPGFNGPLTIVVDAARGGSAQQAADAVAAEFRGHSDVAAIGRPTLNRAGDTAIISLTPRSGPSTTETKDLVADIRDRAGALDEQLNAEILVTGATATNIDVSDRMGAALVPYLAVIVGLAMLLLMIAFRSLLVPLTALGGFLLTIGAAFGMTVLVFQEGFAASLIGVEQTAPIISLLPVLIIGILFGLAMDYQVFLVSRMREEHVHGADPDTAVKEGFRHGARVVTAAALIMGAVFSGFILEDDAIIKSIGFALAFGILVDAFIVRMTLIPALMSLLGTRAWWLPRWLDRALPRVDIEGETLRTDHGTPAAAGAAPEKAAV
ncbi:MMPL family transporter [Conexibacter sp. JD483]|uniref:MMPL family transporter n=1 Tax=unclassified Conexibacter TaxID=2627773 RepID=UPI00272156E4|nr:MULTISPECIES: MMPL family transporter [unclassified Conexibacter]MDO8187384.1 MMPL family transporter [Conexibacter sp. CPCC 205706]MDO8200979.1 MMPL family transporter [Conexibacter sp. CPCC 205762]MDR9371399.1 MMPL family transporter [Conexibacter sp. JD483]